MINLFINSAVNSQTYLANTFSSTNDSITGDITTVNLATQAFGSDLANLGQLIDLTDLSVALIKKNNVNFKEIVCYIRRI